MPLKIETLFCDAAIEREILSGGELSECLERAGEEGSVHAVAVELEYMTATQVQRLYERIYQGLDDRYRKLRQVQVDCPSCEHEMTARFHLSYRVVPCPSCLHPLELRPKPQEEQTGEFLGVQDEDVTPQPTARPLEQPKKKPKPEKPAGDQGFPRELAGHRIKSKLGEGGMGVVYLAKNPEREHVALKVLPKKASEKLLDLKGLMKQIKLLAQLQHPNIRRLRKLKGDTDNYYLIMEYVEGQSLEELRRRLGRLKPRLVLKVAYQVASALSHAHSHGVLHRDVKPHNILVSTSREIKLTDFGMTLSPEAISEWTVTGKIQGTPSYMSPEQCKGKGKVDERSDLYSLGMTMYHCLAGKLPFEGDPISIVYQQVHGRIPSIREFAPDLPAPIVQVVMQLVARDPVHRYPDATTLMADLDYVISGKAPRRKPRKDHVTLAQMDQVRQIQDDMHESTGVRVPMEEILVRKGWVATKEETLNEIIDASEPYVCECQVRDQKDALDHEFACDECRRWITFDNQVQLTVQSGHIVVEPLGDFLQKDGTGPMLDRHLRAMLTHGVREIVLDLGRSDEIAADACGWVVDLAQSALRAQASVSMLFPSAQAREQFCALGFDQFIRVYPSHRAFYEMISDASTSGERRVHAARKADQVRPESPVRGTGRHKGRGKRGRGGARGERTETGRRRGRGKARGRERERAPEPPKPRSQAERGETVERSELSFSPQEEPTIDRLDSPKLKRPPTADLTAAAAAASVDKEPTPALEASFEVAFFEAYQSGDFATAAEVLTVDYDEVSHFSPRWSYYRGICHWRLGNYGEAFDDLSAVMTVDGTNAEAAYVRGLIQQAMGKAEGAISDFTSALELAPRHVKALCSRGAILYVAEQLDEAFADFKAALVVNPRHVRSLYGMGTICLDRDQLRLAEELLLQANDQDPEFAGVYYSLARLSARRKQPQEALQHLRQAISRSPHLFAKADEEPDFASLRKNSRLTAHYESLRPQPD